MITLYILIWVISGILSFGMSFGYFHRKYPKIAKEELKNDMLLSLVYILLAPSAVIFLYFYTNKVQYGLKFKYVSEFDDYGNKL